MSYFPYPVVTPNDGLMGVARVIFFRQSRWDDRVSLHDGIAIDAGYSTKDAWLARVKGDFPRIANGWRLQAVAEASRSPDFATGVDLVGPVTRQATRVEVTRSLGGPLAVAVRGERVHLNGHYPTTQAGYSEVPFSSTDYQTRVALVADLRDREYDTRRGALVQIGLFAGSVDRGYNGSYGLASGWASLSPGTRVTGRIGFKLMSRKYLDARRTMPAWEDEFVVGGGPESNRSLPMAFRTNDKMQLASVEIRHDIFTFPAGAIALIAFVDAGRAYCDCVFLIDTPGVDYTVDDWVVGPGGGIAVRLLRNAIMTATVGVAKGKARVYVGTGWSW